jgi:prolyl 4-hydroxylase
MTPRLKAWLWCLLLVAITTVPSYVSASYVDAIASALDTIVPEQVRFWSKHVPSEDASASPNVPIGDVDASAVDDAAVEDKRAKLVATVDCSKDGTCDTGDLYDGDVGGKKNANEQQHIEVECVDNHESCEAWASTGECQENPAFMIKNCQKSCFICGTIEIDMGDAQNIKRGNEDAIHKLLEKTEDYLRNTIGKNYETRPLLELCKNKHADCAEWAVHGECENNREYMTLNCAPVCKTCDQLSMSKRCPIDLEKMPNAWKPGDVNAFFTNITTLEEYKQYEPKVLSAPSYLAGDIEETADYKVDGPWVVILDNVVTESEAERLIELGAIEGYEQSFAGGKLKPDGTYEPGFSQTRTSSNAWCKGECYKDPIAQRVIERITNITKIPETNSEYLQMLKYNPGEFYKTHHDYLAYGDTRQTGARLITVFLYLNDVEEGGGTEFPNYDITVMPKRGRALIWPSVKDEDPDKQDDRTMHQALPVIKGVKYGANAWIHQRDFKTPFTNGCN